MIKTLQLITITVVTVLLALGRAAGQSAKSPGLFLDQYIQQGLSSNMALQEKQFHVDKSLSALQEARRLFQPTVMILGDYSLATGGRKIDLPLADLLNSAYKSLNQLTVSNQFPMVENQKISFLRPILQDTRLHSTVPVINGELRYFNQIQKEAIVEKQAELNIYKRELIRDIRLAYYQYQQILKVIQIYKNAEKLLRQNLQFSEILLKNDVLQRSSVLKIQSQILKNASLRAEAENKSTAAANYFNFLLNRPILDSIELDTIPENSLVAASWPVESPDGREEIELLNSVIQQSRLLVKKEKSAGLPQIGLFLDAGIQGSNFRASEGNGYVFGGLQLKWCVFNGFRTASRIKQASINLQAFELKRSEALLWIEIDYTKRKLELNSAIAKLASSKSNQELSIEIYRETQIRYRQGQVLVIELMDAFTQLINSQLDCEINQTEILIKQAEVERSAASYIL